MKNTVYLGLFLKKHNTDTQIVNRLFQKYIFVCHLEPKVYFVSVIQIICLSCLYKVNFKTKYLVGLGTKNRLFGAEYLQSLA